MQFCGLEARFKVGCGLRVALGAQKLLLERVDLGLRVALFALKFLLERVGLGLCVVLCAIKFLLERVAFSGSVCGRGVGGVARSGRRGEFVFERLEFFFEALKLALALKVCLGRGLERGR